MAVESSLFTEIEPTAGYLITSDKGGLAKFLTPADKTGGVDVVNNYRWTLTEGGGGDQKGREETPRAILTEWRLLQSALINSAKYYAVGTSQQAPGGGSNPSLSQPGMQGYAGLFDFQNPSGFWYVLPYFSEVTGELDNTWTALDILDKIKGATDMVSPQIGDMLDLVTQGVMFGKEANYPRVGIMDRPKLWESSNFRTINIKFSLFNTVEYTDIKKNWDLCYLLQYQNMFNKRDFITAIPPVFYTVYIPGQFFSIASYVSSLKIYNRGNIRAMVIDNTGKRRNIPDAYEIDMTLTDMVMPSQNMLSVLLREEPIQVQYI